MNENMENEAISLLEIAKMMLRRWWLFLLAIVVFVTGSVTYTKLFVAPVYVSYGTMYISNSTVGGQSNVNLTDVMLAQELVSTYTEILSSNTFMKMVAEDSGLGYDYREIRSRISFSQKDEAPVMMVKVAAYDPKEAHILAETVLNSAQEEVSRVVPGGVVGIIDHAEEPVAPSSPSYPKNIMLAAVLAVALVAIFVFCIEFFDDRLKSRQELSKFGLPVLVEIPYVLNEDEKTKKKKKFFKKKSA